MLTLLRTVRWRGLPQVPRTPDGAHRAGAEVPARSQRLLGRILILEIALSSTVVSVLAVGVEVRVHPWPHAGRHPGIHGVAHRGRHPRRHAGTHARGHARVHGRTSAGIRIGALSPLLGHVHGRGRIRGHPPGVHRAASLRSALHAHLGHHHVAVHAAAVHAHAHVAHRCHSVHRRHHSLLVTGALVVAAHLVAGAHLAELSLVLEGDDARCCRGRRRRRRHHGCGRKCGIASCCVSVTGTVHASPIVAYSRNLRKIYLFRFGFAFTFVFIRNGDSQL